MPAHTPMNVSRQLIEELPASWQDRLHAASLFSSPAFAAVWRAKAGRPVCWTATRNDQIEAALMGVEFGRGPLARFQAMPDGLPSALHLLSADIDRDSAGQALLNAIAAHGYAKAFVTDFANAYSRNSAMDTVACETAIAVTTPDWEPPDRTLRSEIRKAERENVEITQFSSDDHLGDFLDLLRKTEKRLDIPARYPDEFYAALAAAAEHDVRIVWLMVYAGSKPAASQVYLRDDFRALYWVSCVDKEFSYLKATQYMLWRQGRAFAEIGATQLNLGRTPPEADSLEIFKRKWGAEPYHYRQYHVRSLLGRLK